MYCSDCTPLSSLSPHIRRKKFLVLPILATRCGSCTGFPCDTYVENLAVRPKRQILVTLLINFLYFWPAEPDLPGEAVVAYEFPKALGLTGIVEYRPDVFAVFAKIFSISTTDPGTGTRAIWTSVGVAVTSNETRVNGPPKGRTDSYHHRSHISE